MELPSSGQSVATATNQPQPEPPPSIPEHRLLRCIGRGSYGQVWLAQNAMAVYRAVKIVFRKSFDSERPFVRELKGIRKFEPVSRLHDGFIDVLQVGINEAQGYFYYIMELGDDQASGQEIEPEKYLPSTLGSKITHGRLGLNECLQLGIALTQSLSDLHKHELVHRDIKPSNIIFVNGTPKLADIGLVADMNETRSYVGTEGFIPPEGPGTPVADLYSLGKVLYEASTGKDRHDFPELPITWSESPEYHGLLELNEVILKSCKKDPAKRYASAADMHADLLVVLNGKSLRRLRLLEQRLSHIKRLATIVGASLIIAAVLSYNIYREWRAANEARGRLITANISYGNRSMESGDLLAALPYYAEALRLDHGDPDHEAAHRLRFGSVLAQCPKLTQMWFAATRANDACFSPDGKHAVFAEYYGKAEVRDIHNGHLHLHAFGPKFGLRSITYSPDGRFIVTSTESQAAIVWDATSLDKIIELPHSNTVFTARFSPDGRKIVTACLDGQARVWDAHTFQLQFTLGPHRDGAVFADFSHDGRIIASVSRDGTVHLWHATNGEPTGLRLPHNNWVTYLAFSPDDQRLVTACQDHKAYVWDLSTGKTISPVLEHDDGVVSSEFSPDGLLILTASFDGTVRLWRANDLQPLSSNPILRHTERLTHASFSPDGRLIITTCNDGSVRIWDLAGSTAPPQALRRFFSGDGSRYLTVGSNFLGIYDTETAKASGSAISPSTQPEISLENAELSYDGRFVLTRSIDRRKANLTNYLVTIWNSDTGESLGPPVVLPNSQARAILSDDGQRLAVSCGQTAQVWTVRSGTVLSPPILHEVPVSLGVFSLNGLTLVTTAGTNVYVWHSASGLPAFGRLEHPMPVDYVEFSRDGQYFVTCCSDPNLTKCFAQIWNPRTGRAVGEPLRHADGVLSARFSHDGKRVITASEDFSARVWEAMTSKPVGLPLKHKHRVKAGDFSPDHNWVATASTDKTARIWDPENTDPLTPPLRHLAKLVDVKFLPGQRLVTGDKEGFTFLWDLPIDQRPVNDLAELAECLSGGQLVLKAGARGRSSETPIGIWERLRTKYPQAVSTSRNEIERWHEFKADESELEQNWFAAAFHLKRLLPLRPDDQSVSKRLTDANEHLKKVP